MATITDLGNGHGRLEQFGSEYASLIFPLTRTSICRLHNQGYLDRDEATQALLDIGHTIHQAKWFVGLAGVTVERWKAGLERARTI